jgi:D-methionine transport system ATP-binding protein
MAFVELKGLSKRFGAVEALKNVSMSVEKGEIRGVIGYSGAGKSTLIRCVNLLERPDAGSVFVDGQDLTGMKEAELRRERRKIGMIFQHFNLFRSRTVAQNVAYALRGQPKEQVQARVRELLALTGIADKINAYPSQLSGGQKQRAAIARALATNPVALLCDEATSALDPQATHAVLRLLQRLNQELGLTIILITHEMAVVKEICGRVSVMDAGEIVEEGDVFSIFASPKQKITLDFVNTTSNLGRVNDFMAENSAITALKPHEDLVKLLYSARDVSEALISEASRRFNVNFNIILGDVEMIHGAPLGGTVSILSGQDEDRRAALDFMVSKNICVEELSHGTSD